MNSEAKPGPSLRDMELEVEAEGREWMRRRLEAKLQAQADKDGAIFPPQRTQSTPSAAGVDATAHGLRRGRTAGVARKKSR
jgi:hypothetical protein